MALRELILENEDYGVEKWEHYLPIYERHLQRFVGRSTALLEIGVRFGGGLRMWKSYLGPTARVFGCDSDPRCAAVASADFPVFIGDQADRSFLRNMVAGLPLLDVVVDDGGHHMDQQVAAFEELFPRLSPDGVYICEDVHTSYWAEYGGGRCRVGTFVERIKAVIDEINAPHAQTGFTALTSVTSSVHFYDSIIVIERGPKRDYRILNSGHLTFAHDGAPVPRDKRIR